MPEPCLLLGFSWTPSSRHCFLKVEADGAEVVAVVTDGAANCTLARKLASQPLPDSLPRVHRSRYQPRGQLVFYRHEGASAILGRATEAAKWMRNAHLISTSLKRARLDTFGRNLAQAMSVQTRRCSTTDCTSKLLQLRPAYSPVRERLPSYLSRVE